MMCYRDITFCSGNDGRCSKFGDGPDKCPRSLTQAVKDRAREWWGDDSAPICQYTEPKELECYDPKPDANAD